MTKVIGAMIMIKVAAAMLLLSCAAPVWAGEQPAGEQPAAEATPIPAAEAEQKVAESRDFIVDLLWLGTDQYFHAGEWDECIRVARQVIEIDPHYIDAYTGPAYLLWSSDRDEEAIEFFRAGIEANPERYEIYHEFGMYYWHRQMWDEAIAQSRKAAEREAPRAVQHMLPNALERAGRKQEALAEWRALLERFPGDPIARRHISALEQELLEGEGPESTSESPPTS